MKKRFSKETYPGTLGQLRKNAKFQSSIKKLADIIRVYEKREGVGEPYDEESSRPEHIISWTIFDLAHGDDTSHIMQAPIMLFGINDKRRFKQIMTYLSELIALDPQRMRYFIYEELQKNL